MKTIYSQKYKKITKQSMFPLPVGNPFFINKRPDQWLPNGTTTHRITGGEFQGAYVTVDYEGQSISVSELRDDQPLGWIQLIANGQVLLPSIMGREGKFDLSGVWGGNEVISVELVEKA